MDLIIKNAWGSLNVLEYKSGTFERLKLEHKEMAIALTKVESEMDRFRKESDLNGFRDAVGRWQRMMKAIMEWGQKNKT